MIESFERIGMRASSKADNWVEENQEGKYVMSTERTMMLVVGAMGKSWHKN